MLTIQRAQINSKLWHCWFCGLDERAAAKIVAGPEGVAICNECVALCVQVLEPPPNEPPTNEER